MKIMAPAGDLERLVAAIKAGADEAYMGVAGFGARRFAKNFSVDEYVSAIEFAHRSNVSVHLTFNTVLSDAELELVRPDIRRLYEAGLDEVIVQDFGAVAWLRDNFPDLPLCASTQLSPGNADELNWYEKQGFKRAVLARELSLDEIRSIRAQTGIELEVFASGALCLGCSGKCYLSSFIGGRSGNRGMCAQPCRQYYRAETLADAAPNASASAPEYGYFLSLKDQLQGKKELAELLKIGVDSIKVEGRMKSPLYVYSVVRYYRDLLDELTGVSSATSQKRLSTRASATETSAKSAKSNETTRPNASVLRSEEERRQDIAGVFNRGYDFGYFYDFDPPIVNEFFSSNFGVEVGRVRRDAVRLSASIRNGDGVVFLDDSARKIEGLNVGGIRLVDPTNSRRSRIVDVAEPGDLVRFELPTPPDAAFLYRTFDYRLNKELENALKQIRRREPVDAILVAKIGKSLEITLKTPRAEAVVRSEQTLERSEKRPADADSLLEALDRFGETPFYLANATPIFDPNVFVPKSLLNRLRQEAVDALEKRLVESYRRPAPQNSVFSEISSASFDRSESSNSTETLQTSPKTETPLLVGPALLPYFSATVRDRSQFDACRAFGIRKIYWETQPIQLENRLRFRESSDAAPLAGSLAEALRFETQRKSFSLDWTFNVGNARAVRFLADRFSRADVLFLSPEISERACDAVLSNLVEYRKTRKLTLGLPVFGRLLAMFTQKTLFDAPLVRLTNADDRRFLVEKNAERFRSSDAATASDFANSSNSSDSSNSSNSSDSSTSSTSSNFASSASSASSANPRVVGSSIYLSEPLDLIDAIPWILRSGIGEVRFDFTTETSAEITQILKRASSSAPDRYKTFSYGYSRVGVF